MIGGIQLPDIDVSHFQQLELLLHRLNGLVNRTLLLGFIHCGKWGHMKCMALPVTLSPDGLAGQRPPLLGGLAVANLLG
jgi:hypothetical protein